MDNPGWVQVMMTGGARCDPRPRKQEEEEQEEEEEEEEEREATFLPRPFKVKKENSVDAVGPLFPSRFISSPLLSLPLGYTSFIPIILLRQGFTPEQDMHTKTQTRAESISLSFFLSLSHTHTDTHSDSPSANPRTRACCAHSVGSRTQPPHQQTNAITATAAAAAATTTKTTTMTSHLPIRPHTMIHHLERTLALPAAAPLLRQASIIITIRALIRRRRTHPRSLRCYAPAFSPAKRSLPSPSQRPSIHSHHRGGSAM